MMRTTVKTLFAIAALGGFLAMLPVSASDAACGKSKRVKASDAECLWAWWENKRDFWQGWKSSYKVRNECALWGKVVAKIDIAVGSDKTENLTGGGQVWKTISGYKINEVTCCSDLSDLCSKSDVLTPEGCKKQFQKSRANGNCYGATFETSGNDRCIIAANCRKADGKNRSTRIKATYPVVKTLVNCNGDLRVDSC